MSRFETEVLTDRKNLKALMNLPGMWIDREREQKASAQTILDLDSSVSETYGEQEGSAYNGHFGCMCYHPLFCFNQFGDLERALLRNGNVASADEWRSVLEPVVKRYRDVDVRRFFRGDAAFARPELYEYLEAEGYRYAIRLPANEVVQREIEPFLTRPVGRPPRRPIVWHHDFLYQAKTWDRPRRVVAKIEWHQAELFPRVGFIVTNLHRSARKVVKFYNGRGTADLPRLRGQPGPAPAFCPAVQPWQLPAAAGAAQGGEALDDDHAAGEAGQDRCQGRHARPARDFPNGRGGDSPKTVCRDPGAHPATAAGRSWRGAFRMSQQTAQSRSCSDKPGGFHAPCGG